RLGLGGGQAGVGRFGGADGGVRGVQLSFQLRQLRVEGGILGGLWSESGDLGGQVGSGLVKGGQLRLDLDQFGRLRSGGAVGADAERNAVGGYEDLGLGLLGLDEGGGRGRPVWFG